jgi:hypothetical protein
MEAGTVPEKVTISHRGARYEIGRGKRYYGIWVVGAPESAPIDRWPETREGWAQAWTRFVSIESPGTINTVEQPRSGFKLPGFRLAGLRFGDKGTAAAGPLKARLGIIAAALLGLGVVLGIIGLFPDYFTGQSLASQAEQFVPHLLYLAGWLASAVLLLRGGGRARIGALLGIGVSAVTLGLFLSDLGQVLSGESGLEAGIVISIVGWGLCTAGAGAGLAVRSAVLTASPSAAPASVADATTGDTLTRDPGSTSTSVTESGITAADLANGDVAGMGDADTLTVGGPGNTDAIDTPVMGTPAGNTDTPPDGTPGSPATAGRPADSIPGIPAAGAPVAEKTSTRWGGPVRPAAKHAGPITLLVLGAIGTVAAFAPSWDSYTLSSSVSGTQTVVAGNAFSQPGWVIAGDVLVMIAVVVVAALAALWRPMRQGAALLAGAIIPMAAQAISALIQVGQPTPASEFGLSQSQASEIGLSIANGLTPIFWVYCVFVIALLISCAWLITEPMHPDATASTQPAWPGPIGGPIPPLADGDGENRDDAGTADESDNDSAGDTRGESDGENTDNDGGAEDGGSEDDTENTYA